MEMHKQGKFYITFTCSHLADAFIQSDKYIYIYIYIWQITTMEAIKINKKEQ